MATDRHEKDLGFPDFKILMGFLALLLVACRSPGGIHQGEPHRQSAMPVVTSTVSLKTVPIELNTFGTVNSQASVAIKAQVSQVIQQVHFKPGQEIAKGELLFTLESRSYEIALARAQADLSRDQVTLENLNREARQNAKLLKQHILSQDEYEKSKASADALTETIKADKTSVEAARLNLDLCRIYAPISGRAGKILVDVGNLVRANDSTLVVINQIKPINVYFSLPQAELNRVRMYRKRNEISVVATPPNDTQHAEVGNLTFIDNGIDSGSGTIELGASFKNRSEDLWPGGYVLVRLVLAIQKDAVVAPVNAVENSSEGKYVFVVREDQTVEKRPVQVNRVIENDAVIEKGLRPGERVVTDGQLRLADGTKVVERHTETIARSDTRLKGNT